MNAEAPTAAEPSREKQWWLRTLAIFQSPRHVFAALRDESKVDMEAREEPVDGIAVTFASMLMRRNELLAVVFGMGSVALVRACGF